MTKEELAKTYHYAYPGGLLVHSLDVAKAVVGMIRLSEPQMPRLHQETAFVAGLLRITGYLKQPFCVRAIKLIGREVMSSCLERFVRPLF